MQAIEMTRVIGAPNPCKHRILRARSSYQRSYRKGVAVDDQDVVPESERLMGGL